MGKVGNNDIKGLVGRRVAVEPIAERNDSRRSSELGTFSFEKGLNSRSHVRIGLSDQYLFASQSHELFL